MTQMSPQACNYNPPGAFRKAVTRVVSVAGKVVGGATAAIPGAVVGGLYGAQFKCPPEERHSRELGALMHAGMSVLSSASQDAGVGLLLGSPRFEVSPGTLVGAAAGSAWQYYGGGSGNIAQEIYEGVDSSLAETPITGNSISDYGKAITRGVTQGIVHGATAGAREGGWQGVGMVEGVVEGAKDSWAVLSTPWSLPPKAPAESSWSRRLFENTAGAVGGAVGATLYGINGMVHGAVRGVMGRTPTQQDALQLQSCLAGAVGGSLILGPIGTLAGILAGNWVGKLAGVTGEQQAHGAITKSVHQVLDESLSNDANLPSQQAATYRNTIEGALVGTTAGLRNGLLTGFQRGSQLGGKTLDQINHLLGISPSQEKDTQS